MEFRRYFALILLIGFWLSFHGRAEPDFQSIHSSLAFHIVDLEHDHDDSSQAPTAPRGDHKDRHGCYHSHDPFAVVNSTFNRQAASTMLVTVALKTPHSIVLTNILHPPRA
jgi:ABC-type nickel/cobalt efflux system permease component RcnA